MAWAARETDSEQEEDRVERRLSDPTTSSRSLLLGGERSREARGVPQEGRQGAYSRYRGPENKV